MDINVVQKNEGRICDLKYITEMMGWKNHLIRGVMDAFLKQIPEELNTMNQAIANSDFQKIRSIAHTMKSSVSIMGISILEPILREMEESGAKESNIERIVELNKSLKVICELGIAEIEDIKESYN